ncbi:MAG: glycosyltransferase, partial [Candidatus Delongbacteria bacterium]
STDGSLSIIKGFAEKDKRIRIFENSANTGLTKNLNRMVSEARGKYIARMDSDDISRPDRLVIQYNTFEREPETDLVFSDSVYIDIHDDIICQAWTPGDLEKILKSLKYECYIPHPSVMIKKSTILSNNGYNESCRTGQDKELWLRLLSKGSVFKYIRQPLIYYRINPSGVTFQKKKKDIDYELKIITLLIDNRQKIKALKKMSGNFRSIGVKNFILLILKLVLPVQLRFYIAVLRGHKTKFEDSNFY